MNQSSVVMQQAVSTNKNGHQMHLDAPNINNATDSPVGASQIMSEISIDMPYNNDKPEVYTAVCNSMETNQTTPIIPPIASVLKQNVNLSGFTDATKKLPLTSNHDLLDKNKNLEIKKEINDTPKAPDITNKVSLIKVTSAPVVVTTFQKSHSPVVVPISNPQAIYTATPVSCSNTNLNHSVINNFAVTPKIDNNNSSQLNMSEIKSEVTQNGQQLIGVHQEMQNTFQLNNAVNNENSSHYETSNYGYEERVEIDAVIEWYKRPKWVDGYKRTQMDHMYMNILVLPKTPIQEIREEARSRVNQKLSIENNNIFKLQGGLNIKEIKMQTEFPDRAWRELEDYEGNKLLTVACVLAKIEDLRVFMGLEKPEKFVLKLGINGY